MEYWATASVETLVQEFDGQRTIISTFANIPSESIVGVRIPNYQMNGDDTFNALEESKFIYDNSWASRNTLLYPYTLDFASTQECLVSKCPTNSHPGFWEIPINNLETLDNSTCNALLGCNVQ